jgi:hypothetical protein
VAKLIKNPDGSSSGASKQYIESVGGKLHGFWYASARTIRRVQPLGSTDNVSDGGHGARNQRRGALSSTQTTVLLERRGDALRTAEGVDDQVSAAWRQGLVAASARYFRRVSTPESTIGLDVKWR